MINPTQLVINEWGIPLEEAQARNVSNTKEIDDYVASFRSNKQEVKTWLKSNLRNYLIGDYEDASLITKAKPNDPDWLKKAIEDGKEVYQVNLSSRELKDKINHVIDYFQSENAPANIKSISVPDAIKKSDMWLESLTKGEVEQNVPGEELIKEYKDSFSWKKLKSSEALNREGKLMGHCVGSYAKQVREDGVEIYSLRDKKNEPHATIEVSDGEIHQIKGKQNKEVVAKYHYYVEDFLNTMGFEVSEEGENDLTKAGFINIEGKRFKIDQPNTWPKEISGSLNLRGTNITSLPDNLKVGGDLYLSFTPITSLPSGLQVGGSLDLYGTKITSLPDNLKVSGNLNLYGTPITSLPDNLNVGGSLYLYGTKITSLPDNLNVGGSLDLHGTKITSLPDNLNVGGKLNLHGTNITSLPDNLNVGGDLDLHGTKITSLPANLNVGGDLDLYGTKITSLPKDLNVGGSLYLSDTKITSLPKDLNVGGYLNLRNTPLSKKWKDSMKPDGVKGEVYF